MSEDPEIIALLKSTRRDLSAAGAKLGEALAMAARMNLKPPGEHRCPHCTLTFRGNLALAEHVYVSHEGPEPEHWKEAERLAADEEEVDGGREVEDS